MTESCRTDYDYPSSHFAIQRYFWLLLAFRSPTRSMPMDPDDLISGTKIGSDSDGMIELQDLALVMGCLTPVEKEVLKVEYTLPTIPIDGVKDGSNKCDAVFRLCGERLHGRRFLKIASEASKKIREELEDRSWIPKRRMFVTTDQLSPMSTSMRSRRKSSRGSRRSRVTRGPVVRNS